MKIGQSDSIDNITPAHWQKMARESSIGWPMLRERIAALCANTVSTLHDGDMRSTSTDTVTADIVTGIIDKRASSLLQSLASRPTHAIIALEKGPALGV
jgi:hypothetical protein